jgi:S-adenosylhomocysteine hydrolase
VSIAADGQPVNEKKNGYQCTVKGGREGREVDAATLARIGANLTQLTPEQAKYIGVPVEYFCKP